jgi:AcrR family transcriptional regulator
MTLYRRYGNKEEIFRRVVAQAIDRARDAVRIEVRAYGSIHTALHGLVRQLHDAFTDTSWLGVQRLVIAEGARFPALARELLSHDRQLLAPVEQFLAGAQRRGLLSLPDARAAVYQLSALASGGVRFLIREPLRGESRKRAWVDAICEFAWQSWQPRANRKQATT